MLNGTSASRFDKKVNLTTLNVYSYRRRDLVSVMIFFSGLCLKDEFLDNVKPISLFVSLNRRDYLLSLSCVLMTYLLQVVTYTQWLC